LFVLSGALLGGLLDQRVAATTGRDEDTLRTFSEILSLIEQRYMEEVPPDDLIHSSIRGILNHLDPHSNFLDPDTYRAMREEQRGHFSGLGIVISKPSVEEPITVISPIEGTPAHRIGIRAGDVITHIEERETLGMTVEEAVRHLKGPKGTPVTITVSRTGTDEPLQFTIVRDDIPTVSIQHAYLIRPGVGYIRIANFTRTTQRELLENIDRLRAQGMQNLLLDLRGNPGGLLDQAVKVAEEFLERGKMIVYTQGRVPGSDQEFRANAKQPLLDMPLIVLVNRFSASASEIVAGAIQDHDRGLIVGTTTWGKGLVQTVYPLRHDSALALTTARYYTPSGRLIQRDYSSFEDYFSADPAVYESEERETRQTASGRTVYGGGGITPDMVVEVEDPTPFMSRFDRTPIFKFAVNFTARNPDLDKDSFVITDAILKQFTDFLVEEEEIEATLEEVVENRDRLGALIQQEVFNALWGIQEGYKVIAESDVQIQVALDHFSDARQLAQSASRNQSDGLNPIPHQ
jgi:carboxyl-terminal processing protease